MDTYGEACECWIFVPLPSKSGDGKASDEPSKQADGPAKIGKEGKVGEGGQKGEGETGGEWQRVAGVLVGQECVCGDAGSSGPRGPDAKGKIRGQRTVRPNYPSGRMKKL